MKGLFKFTSAALAVAALASCTSDDLIADFGTVKPEKNVLTVNVEEMGGNATTRAGYIADGNVRVWQDGDAITVYDDVLYQYDWYKYKSSSNAFELDGKADLTVPKYAIFPKGDKENKVGVQTTRWEKATNSTFAEINIPTEMHYAEIINGTDPIAYVSNLPMWGEAAAAADYAESKNVTANLSFLTSILKVELGNVKGNAAAVSVFAWEDMAGEHGKNISGTAEAQISNDGKPMSKDEAVLKTPAGTDAKNYITMIFDEKTEISSKSFIYFPIIAGDYGLIQVLWYADAEYAGKSPKELSEESKVEGEDYGYINGKNTQGKDYTFIQTTFTRGTAKATAPAGWNVSAETINELNTLVAQNRTVADLAPIVVTGEQITTGETAGLQLTIPAMASDVVEIQLPKLVKESDATILDVVGNNFTGTLILNIAKVDEDINVLINLPKANVVLAGQYGSNSVAVVEAKSFTVGDGETTTYVKLSDVTSNNVKYAALGKVGEIAVAEDATVNRISLKDHAVTKVTIDGTVNGGVIVNSSETATNVTVGAKGLVKTKNDNIAGIYVKGEKNPATITVNGAVLGYTSSPNVPAIISEGTGKLTIGGAPNYTAEQSYAKVNGDVEVAGTEIDVNLTGEGGAIAGTLTVNSDATLNLTQGYIKAVAAAEGKKLDVKYSTTGAYASVGKLGADGNGTNVFFNTSVWNGKAYGEGIADTEENKTAAKNAYAAYGGAYIYSAQDFCKAIAGQTTVSNKVLRVDLDMSAAALTPAESLTGKFAGGKTAKANGEYPVVEGLTLAEEAFETGSFGLFKTINTNGYIENITFKDVDVTVKPKSGKQVTNVGVLAGTYEVSNSNTPIKNVKVSGEIVTSGLSSNIGGIIGNVESSAILTLQEVTADVAITGYKALGGIIGNVSNSSTVTFANIEEDKVASVCQATPTFTILQQEDPNIKSDYSTAMIGAFVGYTDNTVAENLIIYGDASKSKYTVSNETSVKNFMKWGRSVKVGTSYKDVYDEIVKGQNFIGFSGYYDSDETPDATATQAKINGDSYTAKGTEEPGGSEKYLDYIKVSEN